jgi:tetratricopeptide (TPR) repeat protein
MERLETLGFVAHLTAIRDLHHAIRTGGESPARLGALARGYAQLGVLSEFHWSPAHKAFKARALLYAERLVARDPASAWGLWHRAFVASLVGLPADARADLARAKELSASAKENVAPTWVPLLEAYVSYAPDRLKGVGRPHRRLAALLRMMAVEFPTWTNLLLTSAREVVQLEPQCNRAHEVMCQVGGVSNLHMATTVGLGSMSGLLSKALREVPTLPPPVSRLLADADEVDEPRLVEALARAGAGGSDQGEPSWSVLAHLIRETRFVQCFRRLLFLRDYLAVPAGGEWEELRPLVAGHRYETFLSTLATPPARYDNQALAEWFERIDLTDVELTWNPLFQVFGQVRPAKGGLAMDLELAHRDRVFRDLCWGVEVAMVSNVLLRTRELTAFAPDSPYAMGASVRYDPGVSLEQMAAWQKQAGDALGFLVGAGARYSSAKLYDQAQKALEAYVRQSPDAWAYRQLAQNYKSQGDKDRWKATLDSFLANVEDTGLNHAQVQVEIANDFMSQKRWEEARPYAEAAAQTWAGWGMACAVRCFEGLKDWEKAELWARRTTERYPAGSWSDWYRCCKRTGHGDLKAARAWTEEHLIAAQATPGQLDARSVAYFYWSIGLLDKAREWFVKAIEADPLESSLVLHLALVADESGDDARRDELLDLLWNKHQGQVPRANQVCRLLRHWQVSGKPAADLDLLNRHIDRLPTHRRSSIELFVGRFLYRHGGEKLGLPYLKRSFESAGSDDWVRVLAASKPTGPNSPRKKPPSNRNTAGRDASIGAGVKPSNPIPSRS